MKDKLASAVAPKLKSSAHGKAKAPATAMPKSNNPAAKEAPAPRPPQDAGKEVSEPKAAKAHVTKPERTVADLTASLTAGQRAELVKLEAAISGCDQDVASARKSSAETFAKKARACAEVRTLLGEDYHAYMVKKFQYRKSHANRWGLAGAVLAAATPRGVADLFASEAHARPLTKLVTRLMLDPQDTGFQEVVDLLIQWRKWAPTSEVTPAWCAAAVQLQNQDHQPNTSPHVNADVVGKVLGLFKEMQESLPKPVNKKAIDTLNWFRQEVEILGRQSTTGIAWTQATWNPLHGCGWKSDGCDNCYAAQLMATRMQHRYPGLAEPRVIKGKETYAFTGKILLDPKDLAEVLVDKTPKRYFVNSMSDLFHERVPEDYINAVFDVMERAWWHQYQILTKRPERMAKYSQNRYADRNPPPHIWLGTTVENQDAFDQRVRHLANTKTAVPWLSCEPLLGSIDFGGKKPAAWVVVGGESDSDREMKAQWARSLRDQCKELGVIFFFKQWGDFNEKGEKSKGKKPEFGVLPKLDGAAHGDYPMEIDLAAIERKAQQAGREHG